MTRVTRSRARRHTGVTKFSRIRLAVEIIPSDLFDEIPLVASRYDCTPHNRVGFLEEGGPGAIEMDTLSNDSAE